MAKYNHVFVFLIVFAGTVVIIEANKGLKQGTYSFTSTL